MSTPLHHDSTHELAEYRKERLAQGRELARRRLSRRTTLRGSTLLALAGGSGGLAAFLAACGGSGDSSKNQAYAPQTAAPNATSVPLDTWKDTTETPPYKLGLA